MMAMLFLSMASILALGMYAASTTATASARNMMEGERARGAAESGLRWISWRFTKINRPRTTAGNITPGVAAALWPQIKIAVTADLNTMLQPHERGVVADAGEPMAVVSKPIAVDVSSAAVPGARFVVRVRPHPLFPGDPLDARYLRVTSTGTYRGATRTISMDFTLDKKIKYAMVGKVPIQLGRNVMVEGPIGMTVPGKYPPIYALSDFRHLDPGLTSKIDAFNNFLKAMHNGYDNRVAVHDGEEFPLATERGFADTNGDNYIDEYDLFLAHFDRDKDKAISAGEFTNPATGMMYDAELFATMDALSPPLSTTEVAREGYRDGTIDNRDAYAKVRGQISLAAGQTDWSNNIRSQNKLIQDQLAGPIAPADSTELPIRFGVPPSEILDLSPAMFDTAPFRARTGPEAGTTRTSPGSSIAIENKVLAPADAQVSAPGRARHSRGGKTSARRRRTRRPASSTPARVLTRLGRDGGAPGSPYCRP